MTDTTGRDLIHIWMIVETLGYPDSVHAGEWSEDDNCYIGENIQAGLFTSEDKARAYAEKYPHGWRLRYKLVSYSVDPE